MPYDPDAHRRRSVRLAGRDYARRGTYFVTICTQHRECLLGTVTKGSVKLTPAGEMAQTVWAELTRYDPALTVDAFVFMPNHLHGILILGAGVGMGRARGPAPTLGLPGLMHRFKSLTTARYRRAVAEQGWPPFAGRLWQRGYHERILRDSDRLDAVRAYIADNPRNWDSDPEKPVSPRAD